MEEGIRSVYWEAPEHHHIEKSSDWYWILGIISLSGAIASLIFNNILFSIVILLGAFTMILTVNRKPRILEYEVSVRGIRIRKDFHPYSSLDSFCLDENNIVGPQLIVKSKKLLMPLLILPVPEEYLHHIENIIAPRLREEHLEEPFSHHLLEYFGF